MPWDPKYRKASVQGIIANAIDVVVETGDSGPITPIGINLPNDQAIREKYGSKSVSLSNVTEAYDLSTPGSHARRVLVVAGRSGARDQKYAAFAGELTTNMHEVIGHASGRQARGPDGDRRRNCSRSSSRRSKKAAPISSASTSSPTRSWSSWASSRLPITTRSCGPNTRATPATRSCSCAAIREGTQIEEDHMRNRQMIVRWLMANTKAIEVRTRDGKTYLRDGRCRWRSATAWASCWPRCSGSSRTATTPARRSCSKTYGVHFDAQAARRGRAARGEAESAVVQRVRACPSSPQSPAPTARSPT